MSIWSILAKRIACELKEVAIENDVQPGPIPARPDPLVIAEEIADDLRSALEQIL